MKAGFDACGTTTKRLGIKDKVYYGGGGTGLLMETSFEKLRGSYTILLRE